MADASTLREYFHLPEGSDVITRHHFIGLSREIGMTEQELEIIFTALDTDENDVITLQELLSHWNASSPSGVPTTGRSPVDSDFESSFTLDDSYNGGSFYSSMQSSCVIEDDFDDTFYDISLYHPSLSSSPQDRISPTNFLINGNQPGNKSYDYASWLYPRDAGGGVGFDNTCHDNHNGSWYSNSQDDTQTEPAPSSRPLTQRHLSPPPPATDTSTPTTVAAPSTISTGLSRIYSPHDTYRHDSSLVTESSTGGMDTNPSSTSTASTTFTTLQQPFSSHDRTKHAPAPSSSPAYDVTHPHEENAVQRPTRPLATGNGSTYKRPHAQEYSHQRPNTSWPRSPMTSFQMKAETEMESDAPHQKIHSIRVLKTDGEKRSDPDTRIRSPITLELKPSKLRRRSSDISERPSFVNETIFEYDSPKLRNKSHSLSAPSRRRKSVHGETVYVSSGESCLSQGDGINFPIDLEPLSAESQEQVCELYQNLHTASNPELVAQFENILLNVIKDVRQYKMENERLEKTYRKEKDEHDRHLRHMEDEMEQQVQNIEQRVRKQEKERLESEKIDLRIQLDSEISMLQQNLKKLQQDGMNKMDTEQEEHLLSMKKRLEEIHMQNRLLQSELTDAQTNLALVKTEMTSVKQQLDEKTYELDVAAKSQELHKAEMDKLHFQLQGLHEANKNLLDTNDNLREMLDTTPNGSTVYKRTTSTDSGASARSTSPLPPRKGSVMSDYVDAMSPGNRPLLQPSFQEEVGMLPQFMAMSHRFESCEEDSVAEELDSGHSTLRDANDLNDDTECDTASVRSDLRRGRKHRRLKANLRVPLEEEDESHDEMELESDGEEVLSPDPELFRKSSSPNHFRSPSVGSRGSNRSNRSLTREESLLSNTSRSSRSSTSRRQLPAVPKTLNPIPVKITKEPDRVYKIVLAGDAAVGKSSFIVRLCKGKFVPNLSSTLGVDFQTKMLEVDSSTTALQLWDTAGQERFRSVARTYFRRADGVLLLYDVTYERSFLNIRDWVDAIEENSVKKIPIMLVGNKTDARLELEQQGRKVVKYEDGLRLSKDIDAHFIESSAKDGSNISEAVIELTRALRTNEDLEVQTVGLTLSNAKDKKGSSCCGKS